MMFTIIAMALIDKLGRKPLKDKKAMVRFFLEESVIRMNGGVESCKIECALYLKKRARSKWKGALSVNR